MHHYVPAARFDLDVAFIVADDHAQLAQVVAEGVRNLVVEKGQQAVPSVDQIDLDTQAAENRGVLATDGARAVDDDGAGSVVQAQDGIAVEDARVVEIDVFGPLGPRAGGADEVLRGQLSDPAAAGIELYGMGVEEARAPLQHRDVVAGVETGPQADLAADDGFRPAHDLWEGQPLGRGRRAEQGIGVVLHHAPHGMAQRFGGDGAPVGRAATNFTMALDDGDPLAILRQFHGGAFAAGSAADDDRVEYRLFHCRFLILFTQ